MSIDATTFKLIRAVYRLTLADVAALLDVTESHICRIERGERPISDRLLRKFTSELSLTPDKLARISAIYAEITLNER